MTRISQSFVLSILFITLTTLSRSGEAKLKVKDLPKAVVTAFHHAYPHATITAASTEKENGKRFYEIESLEGTTHRDARYSEEGKIAEIEATISLSHLPAPSLKSLRKDYPNASVLKIERVTEDSTLSFEIHIKDGKKSREVKLTADGDVEPPKNGGDEEDDDAD